MTFKKKNIKATLNRLIYGQLVEMSCYRITSSMVSSRPILVPVN